MSSQGIHSRQGIYLKVNPSLSGPLFKTGHRHLLEFIADKVWLEFHLSPYSKTQFQSDPVISFFIFHQIFVFQYRFKHYNALYIIQQQLEHSV